MSREFTISDVLAGRAPVLELTAFWSIMGGLVGAAPDF
jgi:hypothetical protein